VGFAGESTFEFYAEFERLQGCSAYFAGTWKAD
jgi:hypothetical protein